MKFNPYPLLLATGALLLAAAVFAENADAPSTDEAKHPGRSYVGTPGADILPARDSQDD
jgi:hypothetical protein